jgi:Trypsin
MRRLLVLAAAAIASLALALPAGAITNGTPDGSAHPQVGVQVVQFRGGMHYGCSGTLVSPTVFLLAAHCDLSFLQPTGMWVYFNTALPDPNTIPAGDLHAGTFVGDPGFQGNPGGKDAGLDSHDIAVILLDSPVTGVTPASLPPAGFLDQLASTNGLRDAVFTNVGYGASGYSVGGGPRAIEFSGLRMDSTSTFMALENAYLRLSENQATGNGGTCNFDSGGPQFLDDSNMLVSITVDGDPYCTALDVNYRLDTPSARSFLGQYLSLP